MSEVNQALMQLVKKQSGPLQDIPQADVPVMKKHHGWPWFIAGFSLSLAVGGWAVTSNNNQQVVHQSDVVLIQPHQTTESPTQRAVATNTPIYSAPKSTPSTATTVVNAAPTLPINTALVSAVASNTQASSTTVATNENNHGVKTLVDTPQVKIEQVDLTPEQLAKNAQTRALKALDSNNFDAAVDAYAEALRYTPRDETLRQRLAALYYGKNDVRKAFDLLQIGIEMNPKGETLRIALSRLLIKEKQLTAALTPLSSLNDGASVEYLSLRAALAQKNQFNDMALESYQKLVEKEPNNARWWLGLGIQQERALQLAQAKVSYHNALSKVGVSSNSITFIQDRLKTLDNLQGGKPNAN